MLSTLVPVLLASIALVRAQTPDVDAANIEEVKLVGAGGEVIDDAAYAPSVGVQLTFVDAGYEIDVLPGVTLTRNQTAGEPTVHLYSTTDISTKGYLVVMVDPDAPTPQNKNVSQVRHWLAENLVAGAGQNNLYELAKNPNAVGKYAGPGPESGDLHRYTVVVYEQPTPSITAPGGNENAPFLNFDVEEYVAKIQGLKLVGATYFRVGPYGTVSNNGTYTPPTGGEPGPGTSTTPGSTPKPSGTTSSTSTSTPPPGAASSLRVGAAGALVVFVGALAAMVL